MEDNLIALLQLVEEFQSEYGVRFDVFASAESNEVVAFDVANVNMLASVERR